MFKLRKKSISPCRSLMTRQGQAYRNSNASQYELFKRSESMKKDYDMLRIRQQRTAMSKTQMSKTHSSKMSGYEDSESSDSLDGDYSHKSPRLNK